MLLKVKCGKLYRYFDTTRVVDVIEPVGKEIGDKPPWWKDEDAAIVRLDAENGPVEVAIPHDIWPGLKAYLAIDTAAMVELTAGGGS